MPASVLMRTAVVVVLVLALLVVVSSLLTTVVDAASVGTRLAETETAAHVFWKNLETMAQNENNTDNNDNNIKWIVTVLLGLVIVAKLLLDVWNRVTLEKRLGMPIMRHPPQGPSLPFIGQALQFLRYRPWDLLMAWHRQYGPAVCFSLLGQTMFSVASPALLKIVLQSQIAAVKKDVQNVMKPFLVILGTGIVTSEGDAWMKQRLKMSQPLRRDVLEMIPNQTLLAVQRLAKTMDAACNNDNKTTTIPVGSSLRHLTLQVISGTFLSLSAEESDSVFAKLYLPIVDESNARVWHPYRAWLFMWPAFWRNVRNVQRLDAYVSKLIRERWQLRRQEEKTAAAAAAADSNSETTTTTTTRQVDILDRVMMVLEKENPGKADISETAVRQLRDEMKTFMLAGHETSAAMMTWAIYELLGNSKLMDRVAAEAEAVFGPTFDLTKASTTTAANAGADRLPSAEELANLQLSEACLKESLRKYSVVPTVARRTVEDLYMQDRYFIPKGSSILINIQSIHLDPEIWPNPMTFDPDRFLSETQTIQPFTFLPFIAGPRNCLGQYLALLESKMVISMLAQRYNFSLPPGKTVHVKDWDVSATSNGTNNNADPRHRYMVPVIPQEELMVHVTRK